MKQSVVVFLLLVVSSAAFAADCPFQVASINANEAQVGQPVTIRWSYAGDLPQAQLLTGRDFGSVLVPVPRTSFTYTPTQPGQKQVELTASGWCSTVKATATYLVKQCTLALPVLTVDRVVVKPGDIITASAVLGPGAKATWSVINGTPSATTGSSIQITAGTPGAVEIRVEVSRGPCLLAASANVVVAEPDL